MKQPKENHPIDELFARKLKDHEQAPQSQSWEKIQGRLNSSYTQRRGMPLWSRYAAAASIALVMMAGWWALKSSQPNQQNLAVQTPKVTTTPKLAEPQVEVKPEINAEAEPAIRSEKMAELSRPAKMGQPKVESEVRQVPVPVGKQEEVKRIEPILNLEAIAKIEPEVRSERPALAEVPLPTSQTEKSTEDKTFIVKVVETQVASVEENSEKPARKKKLFSRIAKGLKHIQEGEWKEVGLDSKTIIARTEDNIFKKH